MCASMVLCDQMSHAKDMILIFGRRVKLVNANL